MDFQFSQHSVGEISMLVVIGILTLAAVGVVVVAIHGKGKNTDKIVYGGGVAVVVGLLMAGFGGFMFSVQTMTENQAAFGQQLMDEYHVKINRSPGDVMAEVYHAGESNVVFTRDGKDTPVLIKRIGGNDDAYKMAMQFIVLDANSLYPKPSK